MDPLDPPAMDDSAVSVDQVEEAVQVACRVLVREGKVFQQSCGETGVQGRGAGGGEAGYSPTAAEGTPTYAPAPPVPPASPAWGGSSPTSGGGGNESVGDVQEIASRHLQNDEIQKALADFRAGGPAALQQHLKVRGCVRIGMGAYAKAADIPLWERILRLPTNHAPSPFHSNSPHTQDPDFVASMLSLRQEIDHTGIDLSSAAVGEAGGLWQRVGAK